MDTFRSTKRVRKPKVFSDPDPGPQVLRSASAPRSAYQPVKDDADVEKCRGFPEWRVKVPHDASFPGVMYATFDSLASAVAYATSLRNPAPKSTPKRSTPKRESGKSKRRGSVKKAPPAEPEQCLSTTDDVQRALVSIDDVSIHVDGSNDIGNMFSTVMGGNDADLSCTEVISPSLVSCETPTRVDSMSPLTLPDAVLGSVSPPPQLLPDVTTVNTKSILDKGEPFEVKTVTTPRKPTGNVLFASTFVYSREGEMASPFMGKSFSFKFGPPRKAAPQDAHTPPGNLKRKRPARQTTPSSSGGKRPVDISKPLDSGAPEAKRGAQASLISRFGNDPVDTMARRSAALQVFNIVDLF